MSHLLEELEEDPAEIRQFKVKVKHGRKIAQLPHSKALCLLKLMQDIND